MSKFYSNEIVFRGHPDKVADQIGGALLNAYVKQDKHTRAGIEVVGGKGKIFITGEVTSKAKVNVKKVAKRYYDKEISSAPAAAKEFSVKVSKEWFLRNYQLWLENNNLLNTRSKKYGSRWVNPDGSLSDFAISFFDEIVKENKTIKEVANKHNAAEGSYYKYVEKYWEEKDATNDDI